jgi:hypothetical protein
MAKNGLIGPTLTWSPRTGPVWQRGVGWLTVRSSRWVPPRQGGGTGQGREERSSPRRWLNGQVAEDGGARWSFNGEGAPVNSDGQSWVPRLCRVKEGVRTRSIDQEGAWRWRSPWCGDRQGSSKSGDDGGFPMAMLGQEDKGRLRASHSSSAGKKFVQGRMGNGGGDRQLLKSIVAAWGGGGDRPGVVPRGEEMEGGGPTGGRRWPAATHCRRMRAGGAPHHEIVKGDGAPTCGPRATVRDGAVKKSMKPNQMNLNDFNQFLN